MDGVDTAIVDTAMAAELSVTAARSVKMRWLGHRLHADAELDIAPATGLSDARIRPQPTPCLAPPEPAHSTHPGSRRCCLIQRGSLSQSQKQVNTT